MSDPRVDSLVDEAMRLRLSRRSIMRRGAALGLSTAAVAGVLSSAGRVSAAPRAAALLQDRQLNILQASYFVPEGQEFFNKAAQEWGSQNGVAITPDYLAWPDLQPRIAAAVEGGSGADIIEMWDIWPYLYSENMVPVDELAQTVSEEYGGFYDWVVDTASVDGKWYSVPHGNSSSAFAYRISLVEEAGIEDPKNNFPTTYEDLFALGKKLKEMGKPFGQAMGHSQGDPPAFAYPFMWAHGGMEVEEDGTTVAINKPEFVEALQAFTQHWKDAYDETGCRGTIAPTTVPSSPTSSPARSTAAASIWPRSRRRRASRRSTTRCRSNLTTSGMRASRKVQPDGSMPSAVARWPR